MESEFMANGIRKPLLERLGKEWLFFDGGTGTILQEKGLKGGELPERWNLTRPEDIIDLHCGYLQAGCDIFNTNTFGANALKFPGPAVTVEKAGGGVTLAWNIKGSVKITGNHLSPLRSKLILSKSYVSDTAIFVNIKNIKGIVFVIQVIIFILYK